MKNLLKITLSLLFINSLFAASIFDTSSKKYIDQQQFLNRLPDNGQIVLGEYHYVNSIQKAQANIIKAVVESKNEQGNFTVAWEFLNYPDQKDVEASFSKFKIGKIGVNDLLDALIPNSSIPEKLKSYIPILQTTKILNGNFMATNAPRSWKSIITKGGLSSLDSQYIPPMMELGSSNYLERFTQAMGSHVPAEKIQNYYEAQCYTDSVMAWSIDHFSKNDLRFLVVGAFHSDYNDGVVAQLKRYSHLPTVSIKIVDTKKLTQQEVKDLLLTDDPKYGPLADFLYLVD